MDDSENISKPRKKKTKVVHFRELEPVFPLGSLLLVSDNITDTILAFNVPSISLRPEQFLKMKDLKYSTAVYLKTQDFVNYLGSYKNIIGKKMVVYHRFLYNTSIVYVFNDNFFIEIEQSFVVVGENN